MTLDERYVAKLTPDTKSTISNQYFDLNRPFAPPRHGNECTAYICGRDYMKAVADGIRIAKHFIFIADWQLDYDVELDQRETPGHPGRLSELLADALDRGVHVRLLCYDSFNGFSQLAAIAKKDGPPDTHEEITRKTLETLPQRQGSLKFMIQNPNTTNTINFIKKHSNALFSHHQKFVVIDGHTAFVGGIDLAYGRWDTPSFDPVINPDRHIINDAYNSMLAATREPTPRELDLMKSRTRRPGFAKPLYTSNSKLLNPETQPRMPWNDIGIRINGPASFDVFTNFVLRWNSFAMRGTNFFDLPLTKQWFEYEAGGHKTLIDPLSKGCGKVSIQICRSASSEQLHDETKLWSAGTAYIHDDWKQPNKERRNIIQQARQEWTQSHQTSIYESMIQCIRSAQAYIYIENQFFISDCNKDLHGSSSPAKNRILEEIANAIAKAIFADRPFHVWLILPEHPEGMLENAAVLTQAWWALQSIIHGKESLINRINSSIIIKNSEKWGIENYSPSPKTNNVILEKNNAKFMWRNYLTVLNLRNYGHTSKAVLTEMIYVHSKLMIVDDAVAIIGSANINDRSLLGNGDTELAAVIVDTQNTKLTDMGQGVRCITREFARQLRIKLWEKYLGPTYQTNKNQAKINDIFDFDKPLNIKNIQTIQKISHQNREAYNYVFTHTPRDDFSKLMDGRKKFHTKTIKHNHINTTTEIDFSIPPPLQNIYMKQGQHNVAEAMAFLKKVIVGFFVEMPLAWGLAELHTPTPPNQDPSIIADAAEPEIPRTAA